MSIIEREKLHQATQYLKQLKIQLIGELPHEAEYGLHYINHSISTGILNNTTEIKIDLPSRVFSYFNDEHGQVVDLLGEDAPKKVKELVERTELELPNIAFPTVPEQEFIEFQRYADTARALMEQFRMTLEGNFTFNHLWGHNFDFSVVTYFGDDAQIGVGISPGDEHSEQTYLYVTPWPVPDNITDIKLPIGQWWTDEWTGIMVGWDVVQELDHAVTSIHNLYKIVKGRMKIDFENID